MRISMRLVRGGGGVTINFDFPAGGGGGHV